jgi:hypothetical protein
MTRATGLRRHGRGWRIPAADLLGVRRDRGIAQKVREPDGIVVISWRLGAVELDTGIRPDDTDGGSSDRGHRPRTAQEGRPC